MADDPTDTPTPTNLFITNTPEAPSTPFPVTEQQVQGATTLNCINCLGDWFHFVFNRQTAAQAAINLSWWNPKSTTDNDSVIHSDDDFSAIFMSLAYYAGGIPMIVQRDPSPSVNNLLDENNWFALVSSTVGVEGSKVWNNHDRPATITGGPVTTMTPVVYTSQATPFPSIPLTDLQGQRLVQFIAGNHDGFLPTQSALSGTATPEASRTTGPITRNWIYSGRSALLVPVGMFFEAFSSNNTLVDVGDPSGTPGFRSAQFNPNSGFPLVANNNQNLPQAITDVNRRTLTDLSNSVKAGDYVYYTTTNTDRVSHGLMVVGHGPIIDWYLYITSQTTEFVNASWDGTRQGFQFTYSGPIEHDYTMPFGVEDVPYVVDWWSPNSDYTKNTDPRWRRPRPFYATRYPAGAPQSAHTYWLFVPAPDEGEVFCNYAYDQNCPQALIKVIDSRSPVPPALSDLVQWG